MLTDAEKDAIRHHYRALSTSLPGFRPRQAQREMIACIANALSRALERTGDALPQRDGESIVVVEGPTGVGKSLAYLLAGGIMAQARGKKLVISSATIALQEQLVNRDLPFVLQHSGLNARYALAKGRGRYVCLYRLHQLTAGMAQGELLAPDPTLALWDHRPEAHELAQLKQMADDMHGGRWNGDRDEFSNTVDDKLWSRVTNDRHGCLKTACPNRDECPFYLARDAIERVDIVVTNHDLLLADAEMGGGVILPPPENTFYCIDEAHHLAKKGISQFAAEHALHPTLAWLDKLDSLLARIDALIHKATLIDLTLDAAHAAAESLNELAVLLDAEPALQPRSDDPTPTWLFAQGELPPALRTLTNNLALASSTLEKHLFNVQDALSEVRKEKGVDSVLIDSTTSELGFFIGRAEPFAAVWALLQETVAEGYPPIARWISRRAVGTRADWLICASPVSAATRLANSLWRKAAGAILTSATLRSTGAFDLLLEQTGLRELPQTTCVALDSPFDYPQQGELYLPPLLASPKDSAAHTAEIISWLPRLIDTNDPSGTLVLFSSRRQMDEVAQALADSHGTRILVQGSIPKAQLLSRHLSAIAEGQASIIFGLDSFAEGLDLPGNACVQVIIAKLPFAMPDDPVGQTLAQWITARGGNPFIELTVPEASLKLVQAVGRLIRTEADYGRVTILDNRLTYAHYGKKLLAALPPFRRI